MSKVRTVRLSDEISEELDKRKQRHGDISFFIESALKQYFGTTKASVKTVAIKREKYTEEDMRFARWAWDYLRNSVDGMAEPNLKAWAADVSAMVRLDKRNHRDMGITWAWARKDSFWQGNILSISKFRKQYDTLVVQSKRTEKGAENDTLRDTSWIEEIDCGIIEQDAGAANGVQASLEKFSLK